MEIKLEDYLSDTEIRDIVIAEFKASLQRQFAKESDVQRILTNTAYYMIFQEVNRITDGEAERIIKTKFDELLTQPLYFGTIFKCKDVWDREESPAHKILMRAVESNTDLINKKVAECVKGLSKKDINPTVRDAILAKITKTFD